MSNLGQYIYIKYVAAAYFFLILRVIQQLSTALKTRRSLHTYFDLEKHPTTSGIKNNVDST